MSLYGLQVFDAAGNLTLSQDDRLGRLIWYGELPANYGNYSVYLPEMNGNAGIVPFVQPLNSLSIAMNPGGYISVDWNTMVLTVLNLPNDAQIFVFAW